MKEHWNFLFEKKSDETEEPLYLRKALWDLIVEAPEKLAGDFDTLMLVPNGRYDGFFGINGFDHLLVLGYIFDDKQWYKIADYPDVFSLNFENFFGTATFDIKSIYGMPTFAFRSPVHIENEGLSTLVGTVKNRKAYRDA